MRAPVLLCFLLAALAAVANQSVRHFHARDGTTRPAAPRFLRADSVANDVRADLAVPVSGHGDTLIRLWKGRGQLDTGRISVVLSRPRQRSQRTFRLRRVGNSYRRAIPFAPAVPWKLLVRVTLAGRVKTLAFLVYFGPGGRRLALPLFAPIGAGTQVASLPVGDMVADLRVVVGASGDSRIFLVFRPAHVHLPSHLRLAVTMMSMVMGTQYVSAERGPHSDYSARPFFSMPGIWRIQVQAGTLSRAAALVVGNPSSI